MKAHIARTPKIVLAWGLPAGSADRAALDRAARSCGMTVRPAEPAQLDTTIARLCGLPATRRIQDPEGEAGTDFPAAAVFCGLSDSELDDMLAALRDEGAAIPLKAVVTPINQCWTLAELLGELCCERDTIAANRPAE